MPGRSDGRRGPRKPVIRPVLEADRGAGEAGHHAPPASVNITD